jgi:hypothetical protein
MGYPTEYIPTKGLHKDLKGFWTLSIVRYSKRLEKTMFRKLDPFPVSGDGRGDTNSVGSLRKRKPQSLDMSKNSVPL